MRTAFLTTACVLLTLGLAACGSDESASGGDSDPASLVPAAVPLYLEATIRPEGEQRDELLAAAGKIMRTDDPAGRIRELIDESWQDENLSWERDFAPWVGERAGAWGTDLSGEETKIVGIIAVRDEEAAAKALPKLQDEGERVEYADTEYILDDDGNAAGLVDGFMVVGEPEGFTAVVDARDGDKLADAERYTGVVDELDDDRIGHYYLDTRAIIDAAIEADPATAEELEQVRAFLPVDKLGPMAGSLSADGDGVRLDQVLTDVPDGPLRRLATLFAGGESDLLPDMPADAWAALALPEAGQGARELVNSFGGLIGGAALNEQVKRASGLDLEADVYSWLGDVGAFVSGTTEQELGGALVLESTDDDRAASAFGKVAGLIGQQSGIAPEPVKVDGAEQAVAIAAPGAPGQLVLARGEGRMVLAYTAAAAADALAGEGKLGDSEAYGEAEELLGDDMAPSFVLSLPAVIELVDAFGQADAEFEEARPYLEAFD
ncbi:MAG TPA: DUF3352 domain-containing protein, partial [Solirubrobacteraceae bacterium]|nr:DUF3352 domain-containing protein [Solirubrobacteraceae bacterium]